ncbi:VacB/RNase II family 3'-5' exoribonuclease [Polymorphobacter arshaanensis]|uniref:Ribonuclease R n=1 Tax=Glacieibacterium arshaanense TaxID=2511025 RepID=A0A4Y9ELQ2_9SPHN|nr:VacB/RNase II family 3'-5' exoribonuclease [Polymorphobacter arshaanensis]TFU02928.1 VacB/RNase II family 3'-5' exoribonuclease [Polymorphobacter arshaanensis]
MHRKTHSTGLPTPDQVLDFIARTPSAVGKRDIAKAFGLHGADKIALKALLKDMADAGQLEVGAGRTVHKGGGLPKVAVLRVIEAGDDGAVGVPDNWSQPTPPPRVRISERRPAKGARHAALGVNDRVLARIEEAGSGYRAFPMKTLAKTDEFVLGILRREAGGIRLVPVDKRARSDLAVLDAGGAQVGDLVLAEPSGRPPRQHARVVEILGDPFAPRSFSMIAIHAKGIPQRFPDEAIAEAEAVAKQELGKREDLRALPFLTIDPADARDHDDAVWAAPDDDAANAGGWKAIVAIADVSYYVRPGTALDKSARERGNSVYFPDRVVPMLPEVLSADACSLVENADRAVLACHLTFAPDGKLLAHRFTRATIRCVANIAYEEAQATHDAGTGTWADVLKPLWGAWGALAKARAARAPLDLDLPERRVELDETGKIVAIVLREQLDAHRLIEDFMIAANVAAALALEAKKTVCMYRVHETPGREKLVALKDYLETFGLSFALGQVMQPRTFNGILTAVKGTESAQQISEQVLRTQTQAYYSPENKGHFGLALGSYGHFTSPIRRYADLVVHRALVRAYKLGDGGLSDEAAKVIGRTAEHISMTERRAMEAERDTTDRYVAAYLNTRLGETVAARITGVQRFGFFATVVGIGGDGLVPVSTLGDERFVFDEGTHTLEGIESGMRFVPGQRLDLKLVEANAITGSLRFELPLPEGDDGASRAMRRDRVKMGRRAGQSRIPKGVRRGR